MGITADTSAAPAGNPIFKASLRRTLIQTLILLTFIPLMAMGIAAYLRSSGLLRHQAVTQMQTLISSQLKDVVLLFKTKAIRLERLTNRSDLTSIIEQALHSNRQSFTFNAIRGELLADYNLLVMNDENPAFNQFFLMRPNGKILIATDETWEGVSLLDTSLYRKLSLRRPVTATIFDVNPLYPQKLAAFTIQPYFSSGGSYLGSLVGVTEPQSLAVLLQPLIDLNSFADSYFVTSDGTLIGTNPYTNDLGILPASTDQTSTIKSAFAEMMQPDAALTPVSLDFTLQDGQKVIAQAQWLPELEAGVVLQLPEAVVLGEINTLIPFTILVVLGALLAMALVIGAAINRLINPVISLTQITRRFADGDLNERAIVRSRDEVGLLSYSFNQMAEELSSLYRALEQKVEERTRQIRTAAEVAQGITASPSIDELMRTTTRLIVERFGYYHAGVFILDRSGKNAIIRAAHGPAAGEMLQRSHRLEVGSNSIVGWVTANNKSRVASDVGDDPYHFRNLLLPNTRAEVGIPVSSGELVFGALDVQSTESNAFDDEAVIVLQTLANQLASALQNAGVVESAQVNFQELERLYRSSRQIAQSLSISEALGVVSSTLRASPYVTAIFSALPSSFRLDTLNDPQSQTGTNFISRELHISPTQAAQQISGGTIYDLASPAVPPVFSQIPLALGCQSAAYLPIMHGQQIQGLIMIASRAERITRSILQPYASLADLTSITIEKIIDSQASQQKLNELNALVSLSQTVSDAKDSEDLYASLHRQVQTIIGDFSFTVAIYDELADTIRIPYQYEDGKISHSNAFPAGDGLLSVLIRGQKPIFLVEDVEKRMIAMGVRPGNGHARSWIGAPMVLNGRSMGALTLQDPLKEHAFTEEHLGFLSDLSSQLAGLFYNLRLLEDSRVRALQLETAAEIARDISSSLDLDELLSKAVNFIRERFSFYHASVFLIDRTGDFAVIREATGEAGAQLKRAGHKLGVGSKSIVGYVAGRGEPLVINDTGKDPTYYPNPLLPETRGEAATPLKVGDRILGVLDVQSTQPYAFNEDNLRTLSILADQLAIAVVNSELFSETQEHLSQHRLLHHITTTAASGTTLEEALTSAVNGLQVTLGGDRVSILLLDREHGELHIQAWVGYSEDASRFRIPVGTGITGWVAAHRRPLRIGDTADDPRYIQLSPNTRSELAIPLLYRNELLGVLNVESEQLNAYSDNDEEMLGTLGGSLAAVIANARLLEQIRGQAERERLLFEITSKIRRSTDIDTILSTTASELIKVLGARRTRIRVEPTLAGTSDKPDVAQGQEGLL